MINEEIANIGIRADKGHSRSRSQTLSVIDQVDCNFLSLFRFWIRAWLSLSSR
jgi:hypothetical protein